MRDAAEPIIDLTCYTIYQIIISICIAVVTEVFYRCIVTKLPQATTATFKKDEHGNLEFDFFDSVDVNLDAKHHQNNYLSTGAADSGAGYVRRMDFVDTSDGAASSTEKAGAG